jgi:predicted nucleic-acid-binding Zn-ribbon protein
MTDNCGIYKILNTVNNKYYIGSSKNPKFSEYYYVS